jgi:ribonuclease BN (tRNA processing enzyme)
VIPATDAVINLARGADVFLCEASWTHSPDRPPNLHLSGIEAGRIATAAGVGELLLTHIPPWTSQDRKVSSCCGRLAVCPGFVFVVGGVVAEAAMQDADEPVAQGA